MKLLILASGTGTLAQAVFDAGFEIVSVVSDKPDAQVIARAISAGLNTKVIPFTTPRSDWDKELLNYVASLNPDLVVSLGFMRILNPEFVSKFKVINSINGTFDCRTNSSKIKTRSIIRISAIVSKRSIINMG